MLSQPVPLNQAAMQRCAQALREVRLAKGLSTAAVATQLLAARSQIDGLEQGQSDRFYSDRYWLNLFKRYAEFLEFSSEDIEAMVAQMLPEPKPEPSPPSEPAAQPESAAPASQSETASVAPLVPLGAQTAGPQLVQVSAPSESANEPDHSSGVPPEAAVSTSKKVSEEAKAAGLGKALPRLAGVIVVAAVVLIVWKLLEQPARKEPPKSMAVAAIATSPLPAATTEPVAVVAAAPTTAAPTSAAPAATAPAAKAEQPKPEPKAEPKPEPKPRPPVAPAPANPEAAALVLEFSQRTWIWVRRADESVAEIGVPAGGSMRFEQMPIYLVVGQPSSVKASSRGRPLVLKRTDENRDIGRFTRSTLEMGEARPAEN